MNDSAAGSAPAATWTRLLDLPPTERDACLGACGLEDPEVADDVEALLAEHRLLTAEGFLDAGGDAAGRSRRWPA